MESADRKVPQALSYQEATDFPLRSKTAAIAERHNLPWWERHRDDGVTTDRGRGDGAGTTE